MEETVILAQNGNKEAFCNLIQGFKMDLYKIAKTRLRSEDDIADAVQDTIFSAYQSIKKLDKPENFKKWMIKILINKCNDIYKKRKVNQQVPLEEIGEEMYSFCLRELEEMEIADILKILQEDEKLMITLYYLEDYTSKEIAEILEMNENTVKTKISRAKNKIKNKFEGGRLNG